jgi:hypothetical protein
MATPYHRRARVAAFLQVHDMWLDRLGEVDPSRGMGEWTRDSMERGVQEADVVIAVVSPKYTLSKNCGFEMELAAKYKKVIIPIMLNVPFAEWPPTTIGQSTMTDQFKLDNGDMRLFVDFSDPTQFFTKMRHELIPRLTKDGVRMMISRNSSPFLSPLAQAAGGVRSVAGKRWSMIGNGLVGGGRAPPDTPGGVELAVTMAPDSWGGGGQHPSSREQHAPGPGRVRPQSLAFGVQQPGEMSPPQPLPPPQPQPQPPQSLQPPQPQPHPQPPQPQPPPLPPHHPSEASRFGVTDV